MNLRPVLFLLLLVPVLSDATDGKEIIESLRWVENADPIKNANHAIETKDYRFLGIAGRGVAVPGLPDGLYWEYTKKYGINVIKGTSDNVWGEEHLRLIRLATKYAETYNKKMLEHLAKLPKSSNTSLNLTRGACAPL